MLVRWEHSKFKKATKKKTTYPFSNGATLGAFALLARIKHFLNPNRTASQTGP